MFGGEHSAHYYFRDNYGADSGLIASLIVLAEISRADTVLSVVRKPFERYSSSGEINTQVADPIAVMARVAEEFANEEQDYLDGLTVDCGSWWFNLRPSNTEAVAAVEPRGIHPRRLQPARGRGPGPCYECVTG